MPQVLALLPGLVQAILRGKRRCGLFASSAIARLLLPRNRLNPRLQKPSKAVSIRLCFAKFQSLNPATFHQPDSPSIF
jgi:hypothetical protein